MRKNCHNMIRKKYKNKKKRKVVDSVNNNNTIPPNTITTSYQQPRIENFSNNQNRSLIVGFSKCGKSYLMIKILLRKQEPILKITKSLNQYPNIKAQTSNKI